MGATPRAPYQLFSGDRYNLSLGVGLLFLLAGLKDVKGLPSVVKWQMNAYTNWTLALLGLGMATGQTQWEPFLCTNSVALVTGYRTAMAQGLDENLLKKFKSHGVALPKPLFVLIDHVVHTLPALFLVFRMVKSKTHGPMVNAMYVTVMSTWFAFRQSAKLDSSNIYVPHPWRRAWIGILTGAVLTSPLVDALIRRDGKKIALLLLALCTPWCSTRFDPGLRKKYMFEYAVSCTGSPSEVPPRPAVSCRDAGARGRSMPRIQSDILHAHAKSEL